MSVAAVTPGRQRALYSTRVLTSRSQLLVAPDHWVRRRRWSGRWAQIEATLASCDCLRLSTVTNLSRFRTSMAAPHVAALAALLYSQGITRPSAIEAAIKRFAQDLGTPGRDDDFGYGLLDARATLRGLGVAR
jgi:subtilisin family serine protease